LVYTNKVPTGSVRGFGLPHPAWAIEQMLDSAAHELGLDPAEVARINAAEPGYVAPHGNTVTSCELRQCIDRTTREFGWAERRANRQPGRGVGLACGAHVSGKRQVPDNDVSVARISIDEFGKATIHLGEGEIGQGLTTALPLIAAEAIGLPVEDIQVLQADTAVSPLGYGAYGSRLTFIAGNAVERAARVVRQTLVETAAEMLEAAPEDIDIDGGVAGVRGSGESSKRVTVREIARHHQYRRGGSPITGTGLFDPETTIPNQELKSNESGAYGFTCHAAEVEVDRETGQVRVIDYLATSDCGTVINPLAAEGQVEGAIVTGLGFALHEGFVFEDGRPLNPNFSDYKLPSMADVPRLRQG
ncbi:MAG TPA: molybdopterin cofactor-binding domain-containing protein, partial [Planctomycetaceae bacterium]